MVPVRTEPLTETLQLLGSAGQAPVPVVRQRPLGLRAKEGLFGAQQMP